MAPRTRSIHDVTSPQGPGTGGRVGSALAVAAGYGLAVSSFTVIVTERVFGPRTPDVRLAVLAMTVGALVASTAAVRVRRSLQRRRLRGS